MLLFIFAEKEEYQMLEPHIQVIKEIAFDNSYANFQTLKLCKYKTRKFYIASSGVGKVNAALFLAIVLNLNLKITQIINIGPSASLSKISIGTTFLINQSYYYDVDLTSLPAYKIGMLPNMCISFKTNMALNNMLTSTLPKLKTVNNVTADHFATSKDNELIKNNFENVETIDMELTAYIHCANFYNIPISAIKIISDNLSSNTNNEQYKQNSLIWKKQITQSILSILGDK